MQRLALRKEKDLCRLAIRAAHLNRRNGLSPFSRLGGPRPEERLGRPSGDGYRLGRPGVALQHLRVQAFGSPPGPRSSSRHARQQG